MRFNSSDTAVCNFGVLDFLLELQSDNRQADIRKWFMKSHDKGNGKESKPANPAPTNSERQVGILTFYFLKFNFGFRKE